MAPTRQSVSGFFEQQSKPAVDKLRPEVARLGDQIDAERVKHFDDGAKLGFRFSAQCPVQILSGESGFFSHRAHSASAGHRADGNSDGRCIFGFECFVEVSCDHLGTVEIFGCIKRFSLGHFSSPTHSRSNVPEPIGEFVRSLDRQRCSLCATNRQRELRSPPARAPRNDGRARDRSPHPPPAATASARSSPVEAMSWAGLATSRSYRQTNRE